MNDEEIREAVKERKQEVKDIYELINNLDQDNDDEKSLTNQAIKDVWAFIAKMDKRLDELEQR
jgi:hypothetical protein